MACHPEGYDQKQATAVLVQCVGCRRAFYMTDPQPCCIECRQADGKAAA
jgi:hypothetical protein